MAKTQTKTKTQDTLPPEAPRTNLPAVQKMQDFRQQLSARQQAYVPLLPPHISWDKFQATIWSAVTANPDLLDCNRATLFRACAECAELGLSLNASLKEADILKVWNKRLNGYEAQFRPRFQGLMKLAKQSGEIKDISAHEVYEWDEFDYEHGLDERLIHKPGRKPMNYAELPFWGIVAAYCIWTEADGSKKFEVMEQADLVRIMNRTSSKTKEGVITGPWITDKPEMCRKTVVRRSSKYMPLSAEKMKGFAAAVNLDDKREGGEQVTIKDGDVIDITGDDVTDGGPAPEQKQAEVKQQQAGKMDDLESRMAGGAGAPQGQPAQGKGQARTPAPKPAPAPQAQVTRLDVQKPASREHWLTWLQLSEAAVKALAPEQRAAWKDMHKDLLDACEYTAPDQMDPLYEVLK